MVRSYGTSAGAVEGPLGVFVHILVLSLGLMTAGMAFAQSPMAASGKPIKMVVLGDSLSAGLGLSASAAFPGTLAKILGKQRDKGRDDQCRGVRRYRLGRAGPARLVDPGGNRGRDPRTRRQRRAARHRPRRHPIGAVGHPDAAEGAQDRRPVVRDAGAAELWQRLCRPLQCDLSGACQNPSTCRFTRFSSRASRPRQNSISPTECIRLRRGSTSS